MLTLQFIPYHEIERLDSDRRINKLLGLVKDNKIVLMQGRLKFAEETKLIETTMEEISSNFKGIEICTIYPEQKNKDFTHFLKKNMIKLLLGNREGFTIIGPASLVKEIKRDPNKIQLLATEFSSNERKNNSKKISGKAKKR